MAERREERATAHRESWRHQVRDILAELYGAPRPSIDTATAAASRKSLHRALEEFVREVFLFIYLFI